LVAGTKSKDEGIAYYRKLGLPLKK